MGIFRIVPRKDLGYPAIACTIYYQKIRNVLCDLGASVNLMSKAMFEKLGYPALTPTSRTVELADASIRYSEGSCGESTSIRPSLLHLRGFRGP
jgi:hypothetical protein